MITTLLVLVGAGVFCLFVAWLGGPRIEYRFALAPPLAPGDGVTTEDVEESKQLDSPEWQDLLSESDLVDPSFNDPSTEIIAVVGPIEASLLDNIDALTSDSGGGTQQVGTGRKPGGDGKGPVPGEPIARIPPNERWQIRFREGLSLDEYARQLDHFGIELAVTPHGDEVRVVRNLSAPRPTVVSLAESERREWLMYVWAAGRLREADRRLLERAGIGVGQEPTVQLYPPATEALLAAREREFRGLPAAKIRRTVFEVVATDNGYEFKVVEQVEL